MNNIKIVDCTLRDGGYYNNWDFSVELIRDYLDAMHAADVDYVEIGFRSFDTNGFRGACFYSTDEFILSLGVPRDLKIGVMMNASELVSHPEGPIVAVRSLFKAKGDSPVSLVRFACHIHEFEETLPACAYLKSLGYEVGINLMQIADRSAADVEAVGRVASEYPLDALYFADSLGSMDPEQTSVIIKSLRRHWHGELGIHTHDNMGHAVANSVRAARDGVTWIDATVTGMGRGPGNAQTEYIVIEFEDRRDEPVNISPLLSVIRRHFGPMQQKYGWGKNPYYYLAGRHGIHPTFIQSMLSDARYGEAETLSVIEHLREVGGKKFSGEVMEAGRQMYGGVASGEWRPSTELLDRQVLVLGSGPGVSAHREAIERFIAVAKPYVIALNTQSAVDPGLISARVACHPFRLLADCGIYQALPQPLIAPVSRLPRAVLAKLESLNLLDFGLTVESGRFAFNETSAVAPSSLAVAYALALASSGRCSRILLAGFDGYGSEDERTAEMNDLFDLYVRTEGAVPIECITPTRYKLPTTSVYAM